jgi:Flp pilus assembly pilin Flp
MFLMLLQTLRMLTTRVAAEERGQSMVEYALILAVISIAAVGALALLAPQITGAIDTVTNSF